MSLILDLLFPRYCVGCRKLGKYICTSCINQIEFLSTQTCPYCFRPSPYGNTHEHCRNQFGLDGAVSLIKYRSLGKKIVKHAKYQLMYAVLQDFFSFAFLNHDISIYKNISHSFLLPVPLHPFRENIRGFNQADIIAKFFAKELNVSIIHPIKRTRNTFPQAQIKQKAEREINIAGAFDYVYKDDLEGKSIIIVDDLFTSGSTSKELAYILKQHGVNKVFVLTLAHG